MSSQNRTAVPVGFTIRMQTGILDYSRPEMPAHVDAFRDASENINAIREIQSRSHESQEGHTLDDVLADLMAHAVYGSNQIELIQHGLDETLRLCKEIFRGVPFEPENVHPRSDAYQANLEQYIKTTVGKEPHEIRSRREIMQHAAAFWYMTDVIVRQDEPFSEELIKRNHAILCNGIEHETGRKYAGSYRTVAVQAGDTGFVNPRFVPKKMADFVRELNDTLVKSEVNKTLDPFYVAAFACDTFVNIHPFLDGNGRTCRIILNSILMRYAGVVAAIGEDGQDRKDYLEIAKRSSDDAAGPGELAVFTLQKSIKSLRQMSMRLKVGK